MHSFLLDNENSLEFFVLITGPVTPPVSTRIVEDIEVAGRAGTLTRLGGWHDVTFTIPLLFAGENKRDDYRRLAAKIQTARTITLSHEGGRFRKLKHATLSPLVYDGASWMRAELTVTCQPFTYHPTYQQTLNLSGQSIIQNPGLLPAAPRLWINGQGTVQFNLNDQTFIVKNPVGQILLDSENLTASSGSTAQLDALTGDFPILKPGQNSFFLQTGHGITSWRLEVNWQDP
ncbi:hypothetical protein [Trueperella pyogenes]|uniref:hypothetical protein n=1 Tax=Trueperella pyogenes TaxID=1661 RepID=UPI00345CC0E0